MVALAFTGHAPVAAPAPPPVLASTSTPAPPSAPIEVKVVVVTMFEIGADTGDTPGRIPTLA